MTVLGEAASAIKVIEFFRSLGVGFKGMPERVAQKPHYRLGDWPEIGRGVVGREDLNGLIADQLGNRGVVAIVKGTGGIGKTTLARHHVEKHGERYHGILWVQAETETSLVEDLTMLAAVVELRGLDLMEPKKRARALLDALERRGEDWLIVYDNVPNEKALTGWGVKGARVRLLITSRDTAWPQSYRPISPDVLPTEAPGDPGPVLLMAEAGRRDDLAGAQALAADLGGLPLALVAAGGLIRERGGSFGDYRERLAAVLVQEPSGDYPDGVIGAVKLSYDALEQDARAVLDIFAWYAPEGLEARLLTDVPHCSAPNPKEFWDETPHDVMELCKDPPRVEAALAVLVRRSLLSRQGASYALHRMSAAAVRALQVDAQHRDPSARAASAVLATSYPHVYTNTYSQCARLTPHVMALHRAWPLGEGDRVTSAAADYLFNQASIYLREMAEQDPALDLAEAGLALKRARLLESDREIAVGWSMLGKAYQAAGQLEEAVRAQAENVRLSREYDHGVAYLATAHNNHASALRMLGQARGDRALLEQARDADQAALELRRKAFGAGSEEVAASLTNLALLLHALGDIATARDFSLKAMAIQRKVLPAGDTRLGTSLTNAGGLHVVLGGAETALPLLKEALDLFRTAYGRDDHPSVRRTAGWLVSCHLVLARRAPVHSAKARRIAEEFGLDWDERQNVAAQYPGPVVAADGPPGAGS